MVIDDVEDLDVAAIGEGPVRDVGLPPLVGLFGFEADIGALGALVGLGGDEAPLGEDPPDRADGGAVPVALVQVERDRRRPGFVALSVEGLADLDDLVLDRLRGAVRSPRPRLEPGIALGLVALDQGDDPTS